MQWRIHDFSVQHQAVFWPKFPKISIKMSKFRKEEKLLILFQNNKRIVDP